MRGRESGSVRVAMLPAQAVALFARLKVVAIEVVRWAWRRA